MIVERVGGMEFLFKIGEIKVCLYVDVNKFLNREKDDKYEVEERRENY